jgi:hypothetical protein
MKDWGERDKLVSDVLSEGHALERNLLNTLVGVVDGLPQRLGVRTDGDDSTSSGNGFAVLDGRSGVESVHLYKQAAILSAIRLHSEIT